MDALPPRLPAPFDALAIAPDGFQRLTGVDWDIALQHLRQADRDRAHRSAWQKWSARWRAIAAMAVVWSLGLLGFVAPFAALGSWGYVLATGNAGLNWALFLKLSVAIAVLTGLPVAIAGERDARRRRDTLRSLVPLVRDALRYNQLVRALAVQVQLGELAGDEPLPGGQADGLGAIGSAQATLATLRQDIVQALQAERLLREHRAALDEPGDSGTSATWDAATIGWHARALSDRAQDYRREIEQTIASGLEARQALDRPHPAEPRDRDRQSRG